MSRKFNDAVCVDHWFLKGVRLFHVIDKTTRYSTCCNVPDICLMNAVVVFDACLLSKALRRAAVYDDSAFHHIQFPGF